MRRSEPWQCDRRTLGGIGIASMDDDHASKTPAERTGGEERINRETRIRTRRRTSTPVLVQPAVLLVAPDEQGGGPEHLWSIRISRAPVVRIDREGWCLGATQTSGGG